MEEEGTEFDFIPIQGKNGEFEISLGNDQLHFVKHQNFHLLMFIPKNSGHLLAVFDKNRGKITCEKGQTELLCQETTESWVLPVKRGKGSRLIIQ